MAEEQGTETSSGSEKYFLRSRGRIVGPLDLDRILELRARGRVSGADEVSTDRRTWRKIADLERSTTSAEKKRRGRKQSADVPSYAIAEQDHEAPQPQPEAPAWFCYADDQQLGPFSTESLLAKVRSGTLPADTLVWKQGMSDWLAIDDVPDLRAALQTQPHIAQSTPDAAARRLTYAGFWKRAVAYLIDQFVIGIIVGLFCLPLVFGLFGSDIFDTELGRSFVGAAYIWTTILIRAPVTLIYYASLEGAAVQGTLGKMALNIKVTDETGQRISFVRALGRNFCKSLSGAVFCLGYLAAAFTQRKQALHDLMTGCLVVEK